MRQRFGTPHKGAGRILLAGLVSFVPYLGLILGIVVASTLRRRRHEAEQVSRHLDLGASEIRIAHSSIVEILLKNCNSKTISP